MNHSEHFMDFNDVLSSGQCSVFEELMNEVKTLLARPNL